MGRGAYENYKYNGKELQETGFLDYGWRQYMPELGRWFGMDQLSESYLSTSPYAYVLNSPVMNSDPDGRLTQFAMAGDGTGGEERISTGLGTQPGTAGGGGVNWGNWGSATGNTGLNSSLITTMMGHGNGTWGNTGNGFESNNILLGYSGNYLSLNTNYSNGGIGERYIDIPGVTLTGSSSSWGSQIQGHSNAYMTHYNIDWDKTSKGLGAFGFGNDVKTQLIEYGVRKSAGLTSREFYALNSTAQELRIVGALGETGSKYLKVAKGLGTAVTVATTAYTAYKTYDYYINKGGDDWKVGAKAGGNVPKITMT